MTYPESAKLLSEFLKDHEGEDYFPLIIQCYFACLVEGDSPELSLSLSKKLVPQINSLEAS